MQRVYTFLIDHRVVEEYLTYCRLLASGFCKIHVYIILVSQKTPESGRKVKVGVLWCYWGRVNVATSAPPGGQTKRWILGRRQN